MEIIKTIRKVVQERKARKIERQMPLRLLRLAEQINLRYSQLMLSAADFSTDERRKLSLLIKTMENDKELSELASAFQCIHLENLFDGEQTGGVSGVSTRGFGTALNLREGSLYIHDWNDYERKSEQVPASPETLDKYTPGNHFTAERLRQDIVRFTDRNNFIQHYAQHYLS